MRKGRKGKRRKGKGEESGDEVEGGIWPSQKFWRGAPARLLAGFKGAWKEGRGTEREKKDRREEKGRGGKLEQGHRLAKAGPARPSQLVHPSLK